MKKFIIILVTLVFITSISAVSYAQRNSAADLLRAGLLGAGAGAVGGAVSGADGDDIWKGALAGAGVNIIGGMLIDSLTTQNTRQERVYYEQAPRYQRTYRQQYQAPVYQAPQTQYQAVQTTSDPIAQAYQEGFMAGYKAGYTEGLKEGLR